ncbi:MAG: tetratricopeptide repeat protein [Ignavibacteria bacterium]|nr:tetratricopeptide repeat protein [Ignavibacteria bacterium]
MRIITVLVILFSIYLNVSYPQLKGITSYDNAYRNYISGNFEEAIKNYNEYIRAYANDDKAIYERGMCFESLRKFDDALKDYTLALQMKPYYSAYNISRGYAYVKMGIPANAYDDFTKAIQNDPANSDGYFGRVNADLDLNKFDFALTDLNMAINLNQRNPLFYYVRAMIYTELNDTAKFYDDIEKILDNYPNDFFSNYKSQGVVLILDNIEYNINVLSNAIENYPDQFLLYFRRGFNYYIYRKFGPAADDFAQSIKYCPDPSTRMINLSNRLIENCKIYNDNR